MVQRAGWPSRPELIHSTKVGRATPDLAHLAAADVEDLDTVVLELLASPLAADRDEGDSVLIVRNNIVHLGTNRAARELDWRPSRSSTLNHALVIAAQRARAGDVVADVFGEEATLQRVDVAAPRSSALPVSRGKL